MDDNYIYSLGRDGVLGKMSLVTENIRTSENARANEYVFHLSMLILFACVRACVCVCVCLKGGGEGSLSFLRSPARRAQRRRERKEKEKGRRRKKKEGSRSTMNDLLEP